MVNLAGRDLGSCTVLRTAPSRFTDDVYVVRQAASGAHATVRIVHAALSPAHPLASPEIGAAFAQAAAEVAALDQPHILPLYDFGERDGLRYLILPDVPAGSLADYLAPGSGHLPPLLLSTAAIIAGQAAAALQHAHDADLVHSTLNLHTLLLSHPPETPTAGGGARGEQAAEPRIGLADFGLSRFLPGSSLAEPRAPVLACAAPELRAGADSAGAGAATPASDQYALGCVVYLLLTGQPVPSAAGGIGGGKGRGPRAAPRPSRVNPALPPAVDEVLLLALRDDPAERFPRVLDFATALWTAMRPAAYAERAPAVVSVPNARAAAARGALAQSDPLASARPASASAPAPAPAVRRAPLGAARFEEDPREEQITRRRALITLGGLAVTAAAVAGGGYYAFRHHLFGPAVPPATAAPGFRSARDGIGLFRPSASTFSLVESWQSGAATLQVVLGQVGDQPLAGDWDGTGVERIGVFRPSSGMFLLKGGNSSSAPLAYSVKFGQPGDLAVAGDWLGKGRCGIGVFRPATSTFLLKQTLDSQPPDLTITFGAAGDIPLAGDWNGGGTAGIGVYRASLDRFFLVNTLANRVAAKPDYTLSLRTGPGQAFAGRWLAGGKRAGVGVLVPGKGMMYLKLDASQPGAPDTKFAFGQDGDLPVSGRWAR
jgi:hypothetical protein